jgi:hypothetical protein
MTLEFTPLLGKLAPTGVALPTTMDGVRPGFTAPMVGEPHEMVILRRMVWIMA